MAEGLILKMSYFWRWDCFLLAKGVMFGEGHGVITSLSRAYFQSFQPENLIPLFKRKRFDYCIIMRFTLIDVPESKAIVLTR